MRQVHVTVAFRPSLMQNEDRVHDSYLVSHVYLYSSEVSVVTWD